MNSIQLVLDIGGVVVSNLSPRLWSQLAEQSSHSAETLKGRFRTEIKKRLWTGEVSEPAFWDWLADLCPVLHRSAGERILRENLVPMRAFGMIERWSRMADLHLLSNHRAEWLNQVLEPVKPHLASITVSSETGCCKPDVAIYRLVQQRLTSPFGAVVYVDDQLRNLTPAAELGWHTMLADPEGDWIGRINALFARTQGAISDGKEA